MSAYNLFRPSANNVILTSFGADRNDRESAFERASNRRAQANGETDYVDICAGAGASPERADVYPGMQA